MSGVRAPHLQRRNGVFHLRVRVPDAIRLRLGQSEVVRSLKTCSTSQARSRAAVYAARVMEAFFVIKNQDMTVDAARMFVANCFRDLIDQQEEVGAYIPLSDYADFEIADQRAMSLDHIVELRSKIGTGEIGGAVQQHARAALGRAGIDIDRVPDARLHDIYDGIARALIEQQSLFLLRLDDRLAAYQPSDPFFAAARQPGHWHPSGDRIPTLLQVGPTLGEAAASYLSTHVKVWRPRTLKARQWQLRYLTEHLGTDRPLAGVSPADIRDFRDAILRLRANHGRSPSHSFAAKQTDNVKARIKGKTAELIFEPTKAFLRWAKSKEGLIDKNPAEDISIVVEKTPKGERSRRPFEANEIAQLFGSSTFTGSKSAHRRHEPGTCIIKDARYWLPILGYYTGCRLGELVQLSLSDVYADGETPYLDINEKVVVGGDGKSVKSTAGIRRVPLHQDLLTLGFAEFVAKRRKYEKPSTRLFNDMKYGCDGQASTEYSKIFARLLDKVGLPDPALVFHSFRHGVEDALRDAEIPQYCIDRIVGHEDATMGGKYGKGVSLPVLAQAVAKMHLPVSLAAYWGTTKA